VAHWTRTLDRLLTWVAGLSAVAGLVTPLGVWVVGGEPGYAWLALFGFVGASACIMGPLLLARWLDPAVAGTTVAEGVRALFLSLVFGAAPCALATGLVEGLLDDHPELAAGFGENLLIPRPLALFGTLYLATLVLLFAYRLYRPRAGNAGALTQDGSGAQDAPPSSPSAAAAARRTSSR
jgi:hypothetical protein